MEPPEDNRQDYRFWAFISYSSKDAAMAKKLHRALETYSIPRDLRGRPGRDGPIPTKLFPIFRDRDELPLASDLGSTITDALRASRYLIVLCSPNSAQSHWVDEEIRTYKAMGREDRILAIILDGEPNGASVPGKEHLECFPPSLKVRVGLDGKPTGEPTEPIGGDLRKGGDGWTVAFLKAVAGITGLGFNAFARRELKRKRIRQAITASVMLALAAGGVWRWDYTRVKTRLFESFVLCHGVPRGLGEVDDDRFSKRYMTYRIEESRRKVRRVTAVNHFGTPGLFGHVDAAYVDGAEFGFTRWASSLAVNYREDGNVAAHDLYDATGREILRQVYSADQNVVELRNPSRNTAQTMAADSASVSRRGSGTSAGTNSDDNGKTEIARWRVELDSNGFVIEKSYENAWGDPTADRDGKAVIRYTRDAAGRITGESATGLDGQAVEEVGSKVVSSRQEYDSNGRLTRYRFLDLDGQPTSGPSGYAVEEIHYDTAGNVIERTFLDEAGELVMRSDGFAIFRASYDRGMLLTKTFFDPSGKPLTVPGFGCHMFRFESDGIGREIANSAFDPEGTPVISKEGFHRFSSKLDTAGRQVETAVFGVSGEPLINPLGLWHRQTFAYDQRGNMVDLQMFGLDDQPAAGADGVCRTTSVFDDANRITSWRNFGTDGQPCMDKSGIHETRVTYDARGNISRFANFGADREPILCHEGYHVMTRLFDERGNQIEIAYFGIDGEPVVARSSRVHRFRYRYNPKGQWIETRIFDVADRPALDHDEGHHITRFQFNPLGYIVGEAWFDQDDQPVNRRSDSTHRYERTVDAHGRILTETCFNHQGEKVLNSDGYHKLVQEFDERGNEVSEAYFGVRDEPANRLALGIHKITRRFNDRKQEVSTRYSDTRGKPAPMKNTRYSRIDQEYDERGRVSCKTYFDGTGKPTASTDEGHARVRMVYDDRGNQIESSFFGEDLKPMILQNSGYHKCLTRHDPMGNQIRIDYQDTRGNPVCANNGYSHYEADYDARGFLKERRYFGVKGEPVIATSLSAHCLRQVCDDLGNVVEERSFGIHGEPVSGRQGHHLLTQKFDSMGNELEERYFGIQGEPIIRKDIAAHVIVNRYDAFGQETATWYLGVNDEPVNGLDGFHKVLSELDANGNVVTTSYFDRDGKPALDPETSAHLIRRSFNSKNQLTSIHYEDADGRKVLSDSGFARQEIGYDSRGNMTEIRYFGVSDEPVLYKGGTRWVRTYDPVTNSPLETMVFDLGGNPVEN